MRTKRERRWTETDDLVRRARAAAASDRHWTSAPPRDALLDELAETLERVTLERNEARNERSCQAGKINRLIRDMAEPKEEVTAP